MVIVTEHGCAHLRGKALKARVKAMISIADPAHREVLMQQARSIGLA